MGGSGMARKYYCGLCETSHNALKPRHQCNLCARFYCHSALEDARTVGVTTCVFCDGELSPFSLKIDIKNTTNDEIKARSNENSDDTAIHSDPSLIQENLEISSDLDVLPSYNIEIDNGDLEIIKLIREEFGQEIPLLENEDNFPKNFGFIVKNQRVIGLSLFNQKIRQVPAEIGELVELVKLCLRGNRLEKLPDLSSLKLLQELDISYNQLKELPATLGDIPPLTTLILNNNNLKKIPISLTSLQLKKLKMQNNPCWTQQPRSRELERWIDNLKMNGCEIFDESKESQYLNITLSPSEVEFLQEIERLIDRQIPHSDAAENMLNLEKLRNLSFGFSSSFERIKALGLVNLRLSTLPMCIQDLKAVKMINLSHNHFRQLPQEIFTLISLQGLNLENIMLDTLDTRIRNLTELIILDLQTNNLKRVPKSLGDLKKLEILILKQNDLISLPSSLKDLENLKMIDLRGNPVWNEREDRRELQKWFRQLKKQQCKIVGL
jgi:Leucine-rich repeat (LRR) protein